MLLCCALWLSLHGCSTDQEIWSSDSPEARAALEQGLEARSKHDFWEAREHFRKALELDPEFAVPKALLLEGDLPRGRLQRWASELEAVDLTTLQPHEAFLIRQRLLLLEGDLETLEHYTAEHLDRYPNDPWALSSYGHQAFNKDRVEQAEDALQRLIELDPNWVEAQNKLGYLAMLDGRFDVAERRMRTYQFLAPDTPNPHDSMGELLLITGRYEEARREFEAALELQPEFLPSHEQLLRLALLENDLPRAKTVLRHAAEVWRASGRSHEPRGMRCLLTLWQALLEGTWETAWEDSNDCSTRYEPERLVLRHRIAIASGRTQLTAELRDQARRFGESLDRGEQLSTRRVDWAGAEQHMRGMELLIAGDTAGAVDAFRQADPQLTYRTASAGVLKLLNQLQLVQTLEAAGETEAAAEARRELERVNRHFSDLQPYLSLKRPTAT